MIFILLGRFDKEETHTHKPPAVFEMDKNTRSLKVQKIYDEGIKWDDHEICSGVASLPTGPIKEGDIVTNCEGNVAIRHVPSNTLIGGFNFDE